MSDNVVANANVQQNTPSANDLEAQMAADEASRHVDETHQEDDQQEDAEPTEDHVDPDPVEEAPKQEKENEYEKRLARFAFEKREAQKRARQLEEENLRLKGQAPPETRDAEFERRVAEAAEQRMRQSQAENQVAAFNHRANEIYREGVKDYPDFDKVLNNFRDNDLPLTREAIESAAEAGDPHKIFYHLGKNIDEAERIFKLPAHQMGVAMSKLSIKLSQTKQQSRVPPPIKPLSGKGSRAVDVANMSTEDFMKHEEALRLSRVGRRGR